MSVFSGGAYLPRGCFGVFFFQSWNEKTFLYGNKLFCAASSPCPCLRTALFDKSEVCVILTSLFKFLLFLRVTLGVSTV